MLEFLHRFLLLHLVLNTSYVALGMAVGLLLAWRTGVERRFVVRAPFLRRVVLLALAIAGLITLLTSDTVHFFFGTLAGFVAGLAAAYLARAQAKTNAPAGNTASRLR